MPKKKDSFGIIFFKSIIPRSFFNLVPKESFAPKGTFAIKEYSSEARCRIGLVDDYC